MRTTATQLAEFVERARAGDLKARDRVVEALWLRLAAMAKEVHRHHMGRVDTDDLLNVAAASILRSLETFDPARGVRFSTFCMGRARGAMYDHVREMDHLPRQARSRLKVMERHANEFFAANGRPPTRDELRELTGLSPKGFALHERVKPCTVTSLFDSTGRDTSHPTMLIDEIADRPTPASETKIDARDILRFALDRYGLRSALMLKLKFMDGWTNVGMTDAFLRLRNRPSKEDGVSASAISMQVTELLARLREDLEAEPCR